MRIVQTFWTAHQDPLRHGFGWPHAEYNLMSWALSCLSLRQHYDEVVLYTDSAGKHVLIDELRLPYTDVHVVYDDFECLPHHWALSKVKTYSMQSEPFLHIDGDIYISRPLPESALTAPLVAQNREVGTIYYRNMLQRILSHSSLSLPDYMEQSIHEESVASYNMGFFGGSDIPFICRYCNEVFDFFARNGMNDTENKNSAVGCNVFFEQILFALFADKEQREVASVLGREMRDNGYSRSEFCDLHHFQNHAFHHLLGGHKRNRAIYPTLGQTLLRIFPETYVRILSLFPERNVRLAKSGSTTFTIAPQNHLTIEQSLAQYEDFREQKTAEWKDIPLDILLEQAKGAANYMDFATASDEERNHCTLSLNPYLAIFEIPKEWHPWGKEILKKQLSCREQYPLHAIALIPTYRGKGYKEVPLLDFDCEVIRKISTEGAKSFEEILNLQFPDIAARNETRQKAAFYQLAQALTSIVQQGIVLETNRQENIH